MAASGQAAEHADRHAEPWSGCPRAATPSPHTQGRTRGVTPGHGAQPLQRATVIDGKGIGKELGEALSASLITVGEHDVINIHTEEHNHDTLTPRINARVNHTTPETKTE